MLALSICGGKKGLTQTVLLEALKNSWCVCVLTVTSSVLAPSSGALAPSSKATIS